jgi:pimeloyl-ACP methyl ester carboxylesterase
MKPTIVLVHGAFAESASWNKVIDSLSGAGHPVIAAANPLRSPAADGTTDLYIVTERFHAQFCADVPAPEAARMAATQRPVTLEALTEPSGSRPLWREVPSWFLIGEQDVTIPAALQRFMAERAGARRAVEIPGASHAAAVSHPEETADLILQAAALPATA